MKKNTIVLVLFFVGAILANEIRGDDGPRPSMSAIQVAEGAITVNGRADDWSFAFPPEGYVMSADDPSHFPPHFMRGDWLGPEDLSYRTMAAVDSKYLYLIAFVRDNLLFNGGDQEAPPAPWRGDDFEVYVDTNPPETRFQKNLSVNCAQFIFVPEHLWAKQKGTPISPTDKYPGVRAASRLTPTGYVIEVAIPKAIFPNWKAHPTLDSIGFDVMAGDLDTPGVIGHDPGQKQMMFLLDADFHFKSPAKLGLLRFDAQEALHGKRPAANDESLPGYAAAQSILDHWDTDGVQAEANAALKGSPLARKAALLLFRQRPELAADIGAMVAVLKEPPGSPSQEALLDGRAYAMLALAERHKLPAAEIFDTYAQNSDGLLADAFLYSLGLNGDKSIIGPLAKLYTATAATPLPANMDGAKKAIVTNTLEIMALSLAELGDPTGVPTMKAIVKRGFGPAQPFGKKCAELLKVLGVDTP